MNDRLAADGHRLLQRAGDIPHAERFNARSVYDYGHILHEIQLHAWVLAYRRAIGHAFQSWEGETNITVPPEARRPGGVRLDEDWSPEGLRDNGARPVRPDAVLAIERDDGFIPQPVFIEYDRARRVDKNYDKFRRYDMFLNWWWRETEFGNAGAPLVIFVASGRRRGARGGRSARGRRRSRTARSARRPTDQQARSSSRTPRRPLASGRRRQEREWRNTVFVRERDAYDGDLRGWRVAEFPRGHSARESIGRRVALPGAQPRTPFLDMPDKSGRAAQA
jgi:hypothetical protein